ncbi:MAG: homoserine dehydrogenase [Chitinophagales bacterium]|nr:homoserine dehydrogenase [Bacteroidota bacterium]MBP8249249.1 homoserine dehydrogenase [Chitinophagales bacterium]
MQRKNLTIGVFGFGCVGQGLYDVLSRTQGLKVHIKKIGIKDATKTRNLPAHYFTTNRGEILFDPEIDVVVELINDEHAAFEIVSTALRNGKAVVSASKKMIANNLNTLYALQQQYQVPLLYEGACCASIPIIRNLEEYYDNDLLNSVEGIFNGSTNYILTKIFNENKSFSQALIEAQELGYAETDPTMDIEGFDPKFKLCILLLHAFGLFIQPEHIFNFGINRINDFDINYAKEKHSNIKLLAKCRKVDNAVYAYVLPHFVNGNTQLTNIHNEYNGVIVESAFADKQFFVGKGAGSTPTGSAVLSDISALSYDYRYEYRKTSQLLAKQAQNDLKFADTLALDNNLHLKVYVRCKNQAIVPLTDFIEIIEKYESTEQQYIIGIINLATIIASEWVKNEDINLVVL